MMMSASMFGAVHSESLRSDAIAEVWVMSAQPMA
jgi:hypothetical protein